jgi:hypothetical protein
VSPFQGERRVQADYLSSYPDFVFFICEDQFFLRYLRPFFASFFLCGFA